MSNIVLERTMHSLETGRLLDAYTGVIIHTGINDGGEEISYSSGNNTGYVLEVNNPLGTQAIADAILASLKLRGIRYQPFKAGNAPIDPAAEIGDGVTVNGKDAVIMAIRTDHSTLMSADISAPYDEEVDHEFSYEPKIKREFRRETKYARARLTVNEEAITAEAIRAKSAEEVLSGRLIVAADAITAEVTRATAAEGALSGRITVNADAITSEVERATGAEGRLSTKIDQRLDSITLSVSSSNGSSSFTIKDNNVTIATQTLDLSVKAVNVSGKLTANQIEVSDLSALNATIAGWRIGESSIYKTVADNYRVLLQAPASPTQNTAALAVQVWENGAWDNKVLIRYGGKIVAKDVDLSGKITATEGVIGGVRIKDGKLTGIKDENISVGGISGGQGGSIGQATLTTWDFDSGVNTCLGWATNWGAVSSSAGSQYATVFRTTILRVGGAENGQLFLDNSRYSPVTIVTQQGTFRVLGIQVA